MNGDRQTLDELIHLNDLAETDEDHEFIESQLLALQSAERDTAKQKATLEMLTQQAAAWLVGVSSKHLRDQGVARNADSTYHGPDLVQWRIDREIERARADWERKNDGVKSATERQALARADKLEEEAKGLKDTYVERAQVVQAFAEIAASVRSESEAMEKAMVNDFPAEHRERLQRELKNQIKQMLRRLASKGQQFS
jgi:hypothetical protein